MLQRVVTGVLAAAVALAAILWREPWGMVVVGLALTIIGSREAAMVTRGSTALALLGAGWLAFLALPYGVLVPELLALPWVLGTLTLVVRFPNQYLTCFGLGMWISTGVLAAFALSIERASGETLFAPNLLLLALVPLWVGDSLAYFVGKSIGKHKLAPSISPNKTWEGSIANLLGCMATALALGAWMNVPTPAIIAVGLTTGILGQIGDLLQSRLKRLAQVKDTGTVLPGHGGVLDRLDSFLFSSYPSLLALWLLAPGMFHVKQWPW